MKFLYVTDLHGVSWKYDLIFEITRALKVKAVINGGDILPMGNLLKQDEFIVNFLDTYFKKFDTEKIYLVNLLGNDDIAIFDDLFETICN
ncbi:MAG TPA: phosphoesterase, partial [Candidatus Lokiarchaeia archaeon]